MEGRPFDLGKGRQGPAVNGVPMLGQGRVKPVAPYRIDMSDEDFRAIGDIVVATLAPPRDASKGGVLLPETASPFHVALAVGPLVSEKTGVEIEVGDVLVMEGATSADTLAGRVWFVRAAKILAVVTRKETVTAEHLPECPGCDMCRAAADTLPPKCPDCDEHGACVAHCMGGNGCNHATQCGEPEPDPDGAA